MGMGMGMGMGGAKTDCQRRSIDGAGSISAHQRDRTLLRCDDGLKDAFCVCMRAGTCDPAWKITAASSGYETLCIMTRHAWFSVFTPVLEKLEVYRGRGVAFLEAILDSAVNSTADTRFPAPGEPFAITLHDPMSSSAQILELCRPKDDSTPLADATPDFYMLFKALSIPAIMVVFRGLVRIEIAMNSIWSQCYEFG
eukprot:SAG31_NODE_354_length_17223_cov_18.708771_15_plen_197_part_00